MIHIVRPLYRRLYSGLLTWRKDNSMPAYLFFGYTHSQTSPSSGSFTVPEKTNPFFSRILVEKLFCGNVRAVMVTKGSVFTERSTRSLQISVPTPCFRKGSKVP